MGSLGNMQIEKLQRNDAEMKQLKSHSRVTGAPETLADILMAYCHLLSSFPVSPEDALVLHFQNFHRGTCCTVSSPAKTFRIVLVVLASIALACVARIRVGRLLAVCLRPRNGMLVAFISNVDCPHVYVVMSKRGTWVDTVTVVDATANCVAFDNLDTHSDKDWPCLVTR